MDDIWRLLEAEVYVDARLVAEVVARGLAHPAAANAHGLGG